MLLVCCVLESNLMVRHDRGNGKLRKNGGESYPILYCDGSLCVVPVRSSFHFHSLRFSTEPTVLCRITTRSPTLINKLQSFIQENNREKKKTSARNVASCLCIKQNEC